MDPERLLSIYMNDHLGGAALGTSLAKRISKAHDRGQARDETAEVAREIEEDREVLLGIMRDLGVRPKRTRQVVASLMEKAGRLKPNGAIVSRSPLSRLVELEGMTLGVTGKLALWKSLRQAAAREDRLNVEQLDTLIARAEKQQATLERLRLDAANDAFVAGETSQ